MEEQLIISIIGICVWTFILYEIVKNISFTTYEFMDTNTNTNIKYNKLLEKPSNYIFNNDYLNKITYTSSPLIECVDNFCKTHSIYTTGVIVSLSGGVDSMVLLAILLFLQKQIPFTIYTATIDYGLRKESNDESAFLIKYTKMFNIKNYTSYLMGISRKQTDSGSRSEFEDESRLLRFNTYKKIISENKLSPNCGVFVAHHQDDIIENIFTNIMKGGNLLDLEVMKTQNNIHEINIFRPLLDFNKQAIYDFAHEFSIPYFLDTTPTWSRRGQMRNNIFPLLDSVFGKQWKNKLKTLGTQSNSWGNYINNCIIEPWYKQVIMNKENKYVMIPLKSQSKIIYSNIIMKSLHNIGEKMIKQTSFNKIYNEYNRPDRTPNKIISLDSFRNAQIFNNYLIIYNSKICNKIKLDSILESTI
jgi:tRNA(Ile)-lysidine synthetase-like protein